MQKEPERNPRKVLGKGLSALLPQRPAPTTEPQSPPASAGAAPALAKPALPENFEEFHNIALDQILPGEEQPRDVFDSDKINELSQSIRVHGVLQPIVVYRDRENRYRIIAGERRWRAARLAGLAEIPALVRTVDPGSLLELSLIENIQRENLNPLEEAQGIHRLISDFDFTHEQAAGAVGRSRSAVSNLLRLLNLAKPVQTMLMASDIDMGHARALLAVDSATQINLANQIVAKRMSVREAEKLVARTTSEQSSANKPRGNKEKSGDITRLEEELSDALATQVAVKLGSKNQGQLIISFADLDVLDGLIARLRG